MKVRSFVKACLLAALSAVAVSGAAHAANLRLGHVLSATSHYAAGATAMAEELEKLSGGKLAIKQFPAGALGGEREMIEGVQIGILDLVITSTGPTGNFVPETQIFDIPFLFRDVEHARGVLDGPIGQSALESFPKHNIIALAWGENGFRNLTNNKKPIRTPEDAKGMKIRTMENNIHMAAFRELGVLPAPMAMPELFTALQQGTVDGQENPIAVIISAKLSQVQKHLTISQHVYSPALILISPKSWNALSAQEKEWVKAAAKAGAKAMRDSSLNTANTGLDELRKQGMEITTEIDCAAFESALKPAYAQFAKKFGQGKIDAIRNVK